MRRQTRKKSPVLGNFSFQIGVAVVLMVIFVLGSAFSRELYRDYQVKKEIAKLKADIAEAEKNNYELSKLLDYYKTDEYKESEARARLNLKKDGEKVVMIEKEEAVTTVEDAPESKSLPNYIEWWNYFFGKKIDFKI